MDPVSLGIGAGGGLAIGLIVGIMMGKSKAAQLEEQLSSAQKAVDKAKSDARKKIEAAEGNTDEIKTKLAAAEKKASDLAKKTQEAQDQASQLTTSLQEVEAARAKAVEQASAHQTARQQAEGKARQLEQQVSEALSATKSAESRAKQVGDELAQAQDTAKRKAAEVERLRAALKEGGGGNASASGLDASVEIFAESAGNLQGILQTLLESESQRAAVLADSNGIIVAAAGDKQLRENVAAAAQMLNQLGSQVGTVVPFKTLKSFSISDSSETVIAGRAFSVSGETVSLATLGQQSPNERLLDGAMANLTAALE
ncbi:MAG: hypothetical protein KC503_36555 [Myxococcales bacterium]|nr:hypothetical protein [Myxococcales bacterium]